MKEELATGVSVGQSDMFMRMLKALLTQFASFPPLTRKELTESMAIIQQILAELLKNAEINFVAPRKEQLIILNEDLRLLVEVLINCQLYLEQENNFDQKFQAMVHELESQLNSWFNNETREHVETGTNLIQPKFFEKVCRMRADIEKIIPRVIIVRMRQTSPHTDMPGFLKLLLGDLKEFIECDSDSIMVCKDEFRAIHDDLGVCSSFLQKIRPTIRPDDSAQGLSKRLRDATYEAEYLMNSSNVGACRSTLVSDLAEEIKRIKAELLEKKDVPCEASVPGADPSNYLSDVSSVPTGSRKDRMHPIDVVVGFEKYIKLLKELLVQKKELDIVLISGMAGVGKTTLAKKVYEDSLAINHFRYRLWCCVSQDYNKKEVLLTLLGSISQITDEIRRRSIEELFVKLHQQLTRKRYLIVVDDVWEGDVFDSLKGAFPDDNNGSLVIFTSRHKSIAHHLKNQIELLPLGEEESWALLEQKVGYQEKKCPIELRRVGKEIALKCKGLPLAIVVIAGLLYKSHKKQEWWNQVAINFRTALTSQEQCGMALDLSYNFLPDHLRPLFLYLGVFPEDKEISIDQLKRLYVAEGFVQKNGSSSLEDVAEAYLKDLTDRYLLMVSRTRSDGSIKSVRIHDLLREMSLRKAKEEIFFQPVHVPIGVLPSPMYSHYRISISLPAKDNPVQPNAIGDLPEALITYEHLQTLSMHPRLHSLLQLESNNNLSLCKETSEAVVRRLKLLHVMHFESMVNYDNILVDAVELLQLRYISIQIPVTTIPSSISRLRHLETLILKGLRSTTEMPKVVWEMVKLRHIHINHRAIFDVRLDNSLKLANLETLSTPIICYNEEKKLINRLPCLQKLRCVFVKDQYSRNNNCQLPQLESLIQLKSLKVISGGKVPFAGNFSLPLTLRKLTLLKFGLEWKQISVLQKLLNLEVLKLRSGAVDDELWELGTVMCSPN